MDIYVIMQVIILFGAIFLGVRLGGMGIGYAGGLGVVLLSLGMEFSLLCLLLQLFVLYNSLGASIIWCVLQKVFCVKILSILTT